MLYDLNIPWTPQTTQSELERTLRFSQSLGYNVVALNHTLSAPVQSTITNPIPQLGLVHSSFPPPTTQQPQKPTTTKLPTTLRRATVVISDPAVNHRLPTLAAAYDVLAARPTTEKAFLAACTTMSEISLISLDLTTSFTFHFRPKPCMAAVNRGILFEVCYGQLFPSSSATATTNQDSRARALFIGNVIEIFRATRGRGIIFSSEASPRNGGGTLRAPADVVNLFAVWGLSNEKGLEALGTNPRSVVVNEGLKRRSFRGVVDIVQVEGKVPNDQKGDAAETDGNKNDDDNNMNGSKKQQQQKQKKKKDAQNGQKPSQGGNQNTTTTNKNNNQPQTQRQEGANGKRKHDGGSDQNTTTTTASNPSSTIPGSTNTNKRQAKKMKLAQRAVDTP